MKAVPVMLLLFCSQAAPCADDGKLAQLEQDVRDLQRQVQVLSRQIESQRYAPPALPGATTAAVRQPPGAAAAMPGWVDSAKWQKVSPGMGEVEVIGILGPPTSMRMEEGVRVLFYAMEIGPGFLGGSVRLRDRSVVAVVKPTLQ